MVKVAMKNCLIAAALCLSASSAFGQGAVLQGGSRTSGHSPMYIQSGSGSQTIVQDSGPAGGGAIGLGLAEQLLTVRGSGSAPYANAGTGPLGTNWCDYDAPITNPTGYHYLCMSPNAQGGGLIAYGAAGGASQLPLNFNINGAVVPFPSGAPAGPTVNRHSATETAYTLQQSDCGNISIATNNLNAMSWVLPQNIGAFSLCTNLTVTNAGIQPLFINAQSGLFNIYDSATSSRSGYSQLAVSQNQTVVISSDGASNWLFTTSQAPYSNGYEKSLHFTSYSLSNGGPFFEISGTPTAGDVVGFDFSYDTTPPARNTLSFRYTFLTSTVAEIETAAKALITQMQTNSTLVSLVSPDNAPYFVALQSAPLPSPKWYVTMNMVYPFNPNKNPRSVVFNSPGHTATIAMINDLGGGVVSSAVDIGSWIGLGRGTRWAGREPAAGDRIAGIFITGETIGNSVDNHNYQPIYGSFQWTIIDPTPGVARADLFVTAGNITFGVGNQSSWGLGGVTISGGILNVNANFSGTGGVGVPVGTIIALEGQDGGPGAFVNARGFGGPGAFVMQAANGTGGAPTAVGAGNSIGSVSYGGYNGASAYTQSASVGCAATETYTAAHSGSSCGIFTTATGTNNLALAVLIQPSGGISVGTTFDFGKGSVGVNANTAAPSSVLTGTRLYGGAADGALSVAMLEAFGGGGTVYAGRTSGGTGASPTATPGSTLLTALDGYGFTNALTTSANAAVALSSASLWSASNAATIIQFYTTPTGSTTVAEVGRFQASGGLSIGTTSDPGAGSLYTNSAAFLIRSKTSYTNGAAAQAGTLTNGPTAGNPTKWIPVDDNGTTRYIPAW